MSLDLITIDTDEKLSRYWLKVKVGLNVILDRCAVHWMTEDVYFAVKSKGSMLVVGEREGCFQGFFIMTVEHVYDGSQLRIWAAYNQGPRENLTDAWKTIMGFSRAAGCRRIVMSSPRKGWDRLARAFEMKPVLTEYEIEVLP